MVPVYWTLLSGIQELETARLVCQTPFSHEAFVAPVLCSTATGECCPSGAISDASGACCSAGVLDACGVCNGTGIAMDIRGKCCGSPLPPSGVCCDDGLDSCGVCGGLSACTAAVRISLSSGAASSLTLELLAGRLGVRRHACEYSLGCPAQLRCSVDFGAMVLSFVLLQYECVRGTERESESLEERTWIVGALAIV